MFTGQVMGPSEAVPVLDDLTLVRQAQKDLGAFTELYQRHARQVYRYLLVRVGNEHDAQDLTSQTFLAAMESLSQFRGQRPFAAWLLGIARHKVADQYRSRRPEEDLDLAEDVADAQDTPDVQIGRQLAIEEIARALQVIAPERAEALSLRLFAGLDVPEIARIMDRNEAAVRMLVFRGLRDLQTRLTALREDNDDQA